MREEYGVRFPSGAVQVMESKERALRFSLNCNGLRPDLPTAVVRQVVTEWEEVK
jgi:hypothetical protein